MYKKRNLYQIIEKMFAVTIVAGMRQYRKLSWPRNYGKRITKKGYKNFASKLQRFI